MNTPSPHVLLLLGRLYGVFGQMIPKDDLEAVTGLSPEAFASALANALTSEFVGQDGNEIFLKHRGRVVVTATTT